MNRSLFFVAGGIMLFTAFAVTIIATTLPAPITDAGEIRSSLDRFSSSTASDIQSFRADVQVLSGNLGQARSVVASVASERTPTPGTNAFTAQFVSAVRAADERREQGLRQIEQQLGLLSTQLVDLQQRATSMEIRIQDAVRDLGARIGEAIKAGGGRPASLEAVIALIGILSSLITLGLAVHKEARESAEAKLKIRELEQKLSQGIGVVPT